MQWKDFLDIGQQDSVILIYNNINNRKQFQKQRELLRFMGMSNQVDDFVVWPLERVPHHVYIDHNHRVNKKAFRRYASRIEQKWIDILHTMGKKGMNSVRAMKQSKRKKRKRKNNRRGYRYQDEWERRGQRFQYISVIFKNDTRFTTKNGYRKWNNQH